MTITKPERKTAAATSRVREAVDLLMTPVNLVASFITIATFYFGGWGDADPPRETAALEIAVVGSLLFCSALASTYTMLRISYDRIRRGGANAPYEEGFLWRVLMVAVFCWGLPTVICAFVYFGDQAIEGDNINFLLSTVGVGAIVVAGFAFTLHRLLNPLEVEVPRNEVIELVSLIVRSRGQCAVDRFASANPVLVQGGRYDLWDFLEFLGVDYRNLNGPDLVYATCTAIERVSKPQAPATEYAGRSC